jgi:hypothetical protein
MPDHFTTHIFNIIGKCRLHNWWLPGIVPPPSKLQREKKSAIDGRGMDIDKLFESSVRGIPGLPS